MTHQIAHTSSYIFQTDGNCALAPAETMTLRLVSPLRVVPSKPAETRRRQPRKATQEHACANVASAINVAKASVLSVVVALSVFFAFALCWQYTDVRADSYMRECIATTNKASVTITAGDSLWSIAESHGIEGYDTSFVVSWLRAANNLDSATIHPGDVIVVPA